MSFSLFEILNGGAAIFRKFGTTGCSERRHALVLIRVPGGAAAGPQVELQSVGGALHMLFLDSVIGNAYQNLSNVVLTVTPRELGTPKAVLVGSHFDSIIGSRGGRLPASCRPLTAPHCSTTNALSAGHWAPQPLLTSCAGADGPLPATPESHQASKRL